MPVITCTSSGPYIFRRIDNQLLPALDEAAYIIGQSTARIGNILSFGYNGDPHCGLLVLALLRPFVPAATPPRINTFILFPPFTHL